MVTRLLPLPILLLWTGCSHLVSDAGPALVAPAQSGLKPGVTTLNQTLRQLGPPQQVSRWGDGASFLYEHSRTTENQLGLSVDAPILKYIKFVGARASIIQDSMVLLFDARNLLQAVGYSHSTAPLGKGGAVQIVVTVTTLVDSSQFRQPASAHQWGAAWLAPLPKQLNAAQNLEDGRFGFSTKPVFEKVGQRTLEITSKTLVKGKDKK